MILHDSVFRYGILSCVNLNVFAIPPKFGYFCFVHPTHLVCAQLVPCACCRVICGRWMEEEGHRAWLFVSALHGITTLCDETMRRHDTRRSCNWTDHPVVIHVNITYHAYLL